MQKTFVIGDIHGSLKALQQVLAAVNLSKDDLLIFLGDYVDGWSESAGVIDLLINLNKEYPCIFIKGNHDVWCETWLQTGEADKTWLFHGGQQTLKSYAGYTAAQKIQHLNFFQQMKMFHIDSQNRLFIHASFTSMHGPQQEFHSSNYTWDRTLWEMAVAVNGSVEKDALIFPKRLKLFHEIFIGHTPTLNYKKQEPMQGCNVWNVDTGAAFTGRLTIMDVGTKQYWQSDLVKDLYPNEQGRHATAL